MKQVIIKLGGSVITYKGNTAPRARIKVIHRLAKEIKSIFNSKEYRLILVHGGGSFAHPLAKKYNLSKGMKTQDQKLGFSLTTQKMIDLNSIIVSSLLKNGVPAVGLPPRAFITQSSGELIPFDHSLIKSFSEQNIVPVIFGDAVLDEQWNCSIISGDAIVPYLAKKLKADKVIFLSDVDGIFDFDPKINSKAKLIPVINNKNLDIIFRGLTATGRDDVTGEMKGKIMSIKTNLTGLQVYIGNGLKKLVLERILKGQQAGTNLHF